MIKQEVTSKQVLSLSDAARAALQRWWAPREGDLFYDCGERSEAPAWWGRTGVICTEACAAFSEYEPHGHDGIFGAHRLDELDDAVIREAMLPLLSIGQMCAFLHEHQGDAYGLPACGPELCDQLWERVRLCLEELARSQAAPHRTAAPARA